MRETVKYTLAVLSLLIGCSSCGNGNPVKPPTDATPIDTTAADTPGVDTTSQSVPYFIPLAEGASWKYSLNYSGANSSQFVWERWENHYGTLSLQVTKADLKQKRFTLQAGYTIDSIAVHEINYSDYPIRTLDTTYTLYSNADPSAFNSDTTIYWNIVTQNDTLWYDLGQKLEFFMSWDSSALDLDLRLFDYPWQDMLDDFLVERVEGCRTFSDFSQYCATGLADTRRSYGFVNGYIVRELGGVVSFENAFVPGYSLLRRGILTYNLLEYNSGDL